ncbi:hypothetical protein HY991_01935 [Candidatus Micrarchaeota archaeon]|nr:hypothetical protein [Candidatus Micrarchaeota archaeon]
MNEQRLIAMLELNHIEHRIVRHAPVYNIAEACSELGKKPKEEVKNLLLKDEKGFFLLVILGDRKADLKALQIARKTKKISLATPEEVKEKTGVSVGAVNLFSYPIVYVDYSVCSLEEINVHPDDNSVTVFAETTGALKLLKNPVFGSFSKS